MDPYDRMKEATKWMWALGDYGEVARHLEPHARTLATACRIVPGIAVLDVAAGNGNFAIEAAHLGARVNASDITPRMVELGRARSRADGVAIEWVEADAEALPFADSRFDVVASVFGAMFAPRPGRVAAELFRVARPDGLVAMANYSHDGFLGRFADLLTNYSMSPPGGIDLPSPFAWGDPNEVRKRFDGLASSIDIERRTVDFAFASLKEGWEFWERTNPPLMALQKMVPPERYAEMVGDGQRLMAELNAAHDGRLVLRSDYLQVLARKPRAARAPVRLVES